MPTARRAHRRPLFVLITSNKVIQNSSLHKINFISTTISSGEQRLSANSPWKHITHTSFGRLWCALMRNSEIVVRKWCAWLILLRKWCAYSKCDAQVMRNDAQLWDCGAQVVRMTNFAAQVMRIFQAVVRYVEHRTIFEVRNCIRGLMW